MPSFVWACGVWLLTLAWLFRLWPLRHLQTLANWIVGCLWAVHFILVWYVVFKLADYHYVISIELPVGRAAYEMCTYISYAVGLTCFSSLGLIAITLCRLRIRPCGYLSD